MGAPRGWTLERERPDYRLRSEALPCLAVEMPNWDGERIGPETWGLVTVEGTDRAVALAGSRLAMLLFRLSEGFASDRGMP
jgi:hypothetical protein